MQADRSLDEEGVPDLDGPLPDKVKTGDAQEGLTPPSERPTSLDWGVTAAEQRAGEPLGMKTGREQPDELVSVADLDSPVEIIESGDGTGTGERETGVVDATEGEALSAEDRAVHIMRERNS